MNLITLLTFCILMFTSCQTGVYNEPELEYSVLTETISVGESVLVHCNNFPIFEENWKNDGLERPVSEIFVKSNGADLINGTPKINYSIWKSTSLKKIDSNTAAFNIPLNTKSGLVSMRAGYSKNAIKVLYPKVITLTKDGKLWILNSSEPFFDPSSFSEEKVESLIQYGYKIVWYNDKPIEQDNLNVLDPYTIEIQIVDNMDKENILIINENGFEPSNGTKKAGIITEGKGSAFFAIK